MFAIFRMPSVKHENEMSTPDWFIRIASELAKSVPPVGHKCFARGKPDPCFGREFLWDFGAYIDDEEVPENDRFAAQAAIIGEVEWNTSDDEIDKDFEKLLYVDLLVCFMTFEKQSAKEAIKKLDWLEGAVRRRQAHVRLRGPIRPPAFILSCWVIQEHRFVHRSVLPDLSERT